MSSRTTGDDLMVSTTAGAVRGAVRGDVHVFLDIPYAAPPVDRGRFEAPHPHAPWTGIRDATRLGPTAPQPPRSRLGPLDLSPFFGTGWEPGPIYLTVNVFAPRGLERSAPVLVFVHGGAFLAGFNRAPAYDGGAFAWDGVVFVGINYRLGIPGFLQLPDAPDNRGRLDVLAALAWVHDNIAAFGGDPAEVTLAGQSAGAIIVSSIVASTDARDTFARAIIQSGSGTAAFTSVQAAMVTERTGRLLGVEPTAATLAGLSDAVLVDVGQHLAGFDLSRPDEPDPLGGITPFSLVLGRQPADTLAAGTGTDVYLLIGSNRDEGALYLARCSPSPRRRVKMCGRPPPGSTPRPIDSWPPTPATGPPTPADLRVAILGDGMFGVGTRRLADAHAAGGGATHVYEFTWRSDALGGWLRSSHSWSCRSSSTG